MNYIIRPIKPDDNPALARIIRTTLEEFGANHPGTVYFDKKTDYLYELFKKERSYYFVAETEGKVAGGAGIFPTHGLPEDTCELVKMYLVKDARGYGLGKQLLSLCMQKALKLGYKKMYLETMPELKQALGLYHSFGFRPLTAPMGSSCHYGCQIWMYREL
ncbi:MAG: GNAT family N-acetyltransferase [Chitinophagaceae bacterium]|nr:GNAT family N-acetyltransferase [Chitinophagaceae bacterium]